MFCCVCDPGFWKRTYLFGSEVSKLGSCFSGSGFKSSEKVVLRTYFFEGGWDTKKHVYIYNIEIYMIYTYLVFVINIYVCLST